MKSVMAVFVLGLAFVSTSVVAGEKEKKGPNQQEAPKDAKESAASKSLRDLETANLLIQLGRREKHAESLIVAAQLLHKIQTKPIGVERVGSQVAAETKAAAKDNSPKALVAEATKLSSAPHVAALAEATNKLLQEDVRGARGGPKVDSFVIQAGQTINWNPITFMAGEKAEVYIDNGVAGRMTLQIFDDIGNLVVQDSVPGSFYRCVWYPRFTGTFRIRLINQDSISFRCGMATN